MEKITTYEEYSAIVAAFKKGKARCAPNKLMMRDELTALIEAGKLSYEEIEDSLWFFTDEERFYSAFVYAPAGSPVCMRALDKDVVVELTGNESRYNEQLERSLLEAGFEKYGKYLEHCCLLGDVIDDVRAWLKLLRPYWEKQGFACRTAVKADYPAMRRIWDSVQSGDDYSFAAMTEAELDEMERFGRCVVVSDPKGELCAMSLYLNKNGNCYTYISATTRLGLASWPVYERFLRAYEEGCVRDIGWVRDGNRMSMSTSSHTKTLTGKFFWQFVFRANKK